MPTDIRGIVTIEKLANKSVQFKDSAGNVVRTFSEETNIAVIDEEACTIRCTPKNLFSKNGDPFDFDIVTLTTITGLDGASLALPALSGTFDDYDQMQANLRSAFDFLSENIFVTYSGTTPGSTGTTVNVEGELPTSSATSIYTCPSGKNALFEYITYTNAAAYDVTVSIFRDVTGVSVTIMSLNLSAGDKVSDDTPYQLQPGDKMTIVSSIAGTTYSYSLVEI